MYSEQNKLDDELKELNNDETAKENDTPKHDNQEYLDKIAALEQDNKFFKEKQKDLKKKLREFVNENNHLISIVNKEKTKNSKLKNYIQNVLNIKKETDHPSSNTNDTNDTNDTNNANETNEFAIVNTTKESIDQPGPYHKIRSQEKFSLKRNVHTADASHLNKVSEDNKSLSYNKSSNQNSNNNNNINTITQTVDNQLDKNLKVSRKSLKSNHSSESTLVPSESEYSLSTSTSVADLTKVNFDKEGRTANNSELSLPVIFLKATDNNSIVKTKNIMDDSKNDKDKTNKNNNNNNNKEEQQNTIENNNDYLPSISTITQD